MNDLHFALRQMRKNTGFSCIAILTLALSIGVNTSVFSIVHALLFRPLPVSEPQGLWAVGFRDKQGQPAFPAMVLPFVREFQREVPSFAQLAGYGLIRPKLRIGDDLKQVSAELVSPNYFDVLGIAPALGRTFDASGSQLSDAGWTVILSHDCWRRRFNADTNVVGGTLRLNDCTVTIIGVAPPHFRGLDTGRPAELWVPLTMERALREQPFYRLVGRLTRDATQAQAIGDLNNVIRQLGNTYGSHPPPDYELYGTFPRDYFSVTLSPAALGSWGPYRGQRATVASLGTIAIVAGLLMLLIACANLANLLLARANRRRGEMAIRLALGASRRRLLRQLLVEGMLLSLAGAGAGLFVARAINQFVLRTRTGDWASVPLDPSFEWRVLCFTLIVAILSALGFSLLPALRASRLEPGTALKEGGAGLLSGGSRYSLQRGLVTVQVSVSLVLLLCGGLCLRSFMHLIALDMGFDPGQVAFLTVSLPDEHYTPERMRIFVTELKAHISSMPGIQSVSLSDANVPLSGDTSTAVLPQLDGYETRAGESISFLSSVVGPEYFRTMGMPLVAGREFESGDRDGALPVAVINESFVRKYWNDDHPLGRRVAGREVVGVVRDSRTEQIWMEPKPQVYVPFEQANPRYVAVVVQTIAKPDTLLASLHRAAQTIDPTAEVQAQTVNRLMRNSLSGQRLAMLGFTAIAAIALILTLIGVYGVVAYIGAQRTRELGIRLALGAQPGDVGRMLIKQGLMPVGAGIVLGTAMALSTTRLLRHWLYGLSPTDPVTFLFVPILLGAVALLACWWPGRRATQVDLLATLRNE